MKSLKKGFSLLELIMVLAIASSLSVMKFQELKRDQENILADSVGQQIKQVGEAVNGYINIHYDKLSTLTSVSTGTGTDPGPRNCSTTLNICTITYQTLVNEGLLPASFNGINANRSGYTIVLKREGTSPNYIINGLVTTNNAWTEGSAIRYDLLGKAMQAAGVDSGMTKSSSTVSGYSGSWSEQNSDFANITKAGLLGYRVGYDSAMYSVFLRRDGTLPMTGDLNMGGQDINNVVNISASGQISTATLSTTGNATVGGNIAANGLNPNDFPSGWKGGVRTNNVMAGGTIAAGTSSNINAYINNLGDIYGSRKIVSGGAIEASTTITAGGEVVAHNGYGDTISFGGDAAGNDYEIRLGIGKQLTIYSPNSTQYSTVMNVNRNLSVNERIGSMGYSPNDLPSGWGGGLRTLDVYAAGTIATGTGGKVNGSIDGAGNIYSGNDIFAQHYIYTRNAAGTVVKAYLNSDGNIYASGNLNVDNNAYINGSINSGGDINVGKRLNAYEYVYINGVAGEGGGCSPNGLVGRNNAGKILSCTNGVWTAAAIGTPGYYCRLTSFDKGRSDDYVGYTPRTDQNCPVISPGQSPQGFCSCIKIILNY